MLPAIQIGQTVSVSSQGASPQSGDIIVFSPGVTDCAGPSVKYDIGRVIGLPGQTVSLSGGYVNIDGHRLNETWLADSEQGRTYPGPPRHPSFNLQHAYQVPAGSYYVMGDNRTDSCDSRYWGPVSASSVVGIAHVP
jgi:signal peptidase I